MGAGEKEAQTYAIYITKPLEECNVSRCNAWVVPARFNP